MQQSPNPDRDRTSIGTDFEPYVQSRQLTIADATIDKSLLESIQFFLGHGDSIYRNDSSELLYLEEC
jgi:hypothetical protein